MGPGTVDAAEGRQPVSQSRSVSAESVGSGGGNYWWPYREGGVYLHAAPLFHIADFPFMFAAPAFGTCQVTIRKFNPQAFCETVQQERATRTVLVPTMINVLTQFERLADYDLRSLVELGYGGSPIAPELIHRARQTLPHVKL